MIKRSANKQGTIVFNINFQNSRQLNSPCHTEPDATSFPVNSQLQNSFYSAHSNPGTPNDFEDRSKALRLECKSISSSIDCIDFEDTQPSEDPYAKYLPNFNENGETNFKPNIDEFYTQEPIDFDDLQKINRFVVDDDDKSSNSTLSRSSKKITKARPGLVYKESRFKEEARNKGKRQPWQPYEDEQVLELVNKHGQSWALIASMMDGRTGKQIRDRFLNKLRPDIKNDEWTKEEDKLLISYFHQIGRKWSKIATYIPGRTEGQVKNRFYSHIKKKLLLMEEYDLTSGSQDGDPSPSSRINELPNGQINLNKNHPQEIYQNNINYQNGGNEISPDQNLHEFMQTADFDFNTDFLFQDQNDAYMPNFDFANIDANMTDNLLTSQGSDPTDVISYNELSASNTMKRMSPDKYFSKTRGNFQTFKASRFSQIHEKPMNNCDDAAMGTIQENINFNELTREFKMRCNTTSNGREIESSSPFLDSSPLKFGELEENKFSNFGNRPARNNGYDEIKGRYLDHTDKRKNPGAFVSSTLFGIANPLSSGQFGKENPGIF